MANATAKLNYLRIAPRKVRLVAYNLKGLPATEAEAQLLMRNKRSALPILKLLRSAMSNAKNSNLDLSRLVISSITVDQGPILKRSLPRAQGRATPIHKKTSHITLILSESSKSVVSRFNILPPQKKEKKVKKDRKIEKNKKTIEEKPLDSTQGKPIRQAQGKPIRQAQGKPGFFKKMFRRKSI